MTQRKKYQIFVSSTYIDLISVRNKLISRLIKEGYIVIGMEDFFSRPYSQWEHIEREINESDYYVLILGHRYGSIDQESQISYTEKEFHYAKAIGLPTLVFDLSKKIEGLDVDHFEDDPEKLAKLHNFRKIAHGLLGTVALTNQLDLEQSVVTSVNNAVQNNKRPGWVRAGSDDLEHENLELKSQLASLEKLLQNRPDSQANRPELKFILEIPPLDPLPVRKPNALARNELLINEIPDHLKSYLDKNEVSIYNSNIPDQEQLNQNDQISYLIECLRNTYPIKISIENSGNKKANDVRALVFFPNFIRVFDSMYEYNNFISDLEDSLTKLPKNPLNKAKQEYEKANRTTPYNDCYDFMRNSDFMSTSASLMPRVIDIPRLNMRTDNKNHEKTIKSSTQISIKLESIYHSENRRYTNDDDFFISPVCAGEGEIVVSLISEELEQELTYVYQIKVV